MRIQLFPRLLFISLIQILIVVLVSSQCLEDQRSSLLQLKNTLEFNPNSSSKLVRWNQSDECCRWEGVDCDGGGRVIGLNLENETITGGIETSSPLFKLQYLEKLNLAFNFFNSTQIPKGFQNLTNLAHLNVSNAGFGGQVPVEVSTLSSLLVLDLSTVFGGHQPLRLENPNLQRFVQNLPSLRELYLDNVNISSQRSEWGPALSSSLPNLTTLSLRSCGLSGPLDSSLSELRSLSILRLDGNNLSTTVPEFMGEFSNLTTLTFGNCFLQGAFPDKIFKVTTLQILDLSTNRQLHGTIPELPVSSSLRTMVLSYTNFSGSLPDSIGNLRMLSRIELSNCNFTGSIPASISNLKELVHLDFSLNAFKGSIPPFSMSKKLVYLDLGRNSLSGSLSSKHFEGLPNLVYLSLGFNSFNGSIPPPLFGLPSLKNLQLFSNRFSGQIPEFPIPNPSTLDTLDLSNNQLEGSIPESFFKLEGLSVLSLSSNLFNGSLKLEKVQKFPNLTRLELGYNRLSVDTSNMSSFQYPQLSRLNLASCNLYDFPNLRNQSKLIFLDLSSNNIKGEIPSWIWNIGSGSLTHLNLSRNYLVDLQKPFNIPSFLGVLDLHSNSLKGEFPIPPPSAIYVDYSTNKFQQAIPVNIGDTVTFALFSLANNSLTGTIPQSLCNATYLQVLDLSDNFLNGTIPDCLVRGFTLGVLNLKRNNISGHIPDVFSSSCGLKTLDLSQNIIGGKIPLSMPNCTSLEVLNVGNNKIEDEFPCALRSSSTLRVLVLRKNKFYGDISCSEVQGSWPNLQIIDIAFNNFGGKINPQCIASWKGMMLGNGTQLRGDHIRFEFLKLSNFYYQDTVTVTIKGLELELVMILTVFTAIDFSCNSFSGNIPPTVGDLSSLYVLNLSHNSFSGAIPRSIGNLKQLGSLDLSVNQLTGMVPQELTSLKFLSFLNLSYNMLVGKIPVGNQLQTFSALSYIGNVGLCGFPSTTCYSNSPVGNSPGSLNKRVYDWQLIITGLGFGTGLILVFVPVALCKQWREYYSKQLDEFLSLLFPKFGFNNSRCRRRRRRRRVSRGR